MKKYLSGILLAGMLALAILPWLASLSEPVRAQTTASTRVDLRFLGGSALSASNYVPIRLTDGLSYVTTDTQVTQNSALTVASMTGGMTFGRSSASAPTDVGADDRAVAAAEQGPAA